MFKNRNEKLLAFVLIVIVAMTSGVDTFQSLVFGSLEQKDRQLQVTAERLQGLELEYRRIQHSQRNYEQARLRSLPPDPSVATTLYQAWLVEQAEEVGLKNVQVQAGRPLDLGEAGVKIPFVVQGPMNLAQFGRFVDQLSALPVLHQIRHLTTRTPLLGTPSTDYQITLGLEAMSLSDATPRTTLVDPDLQEPVNESRRMADFFAAKNFLVRGYQGPMVPQTRPTQPTARPTLPVEEKIVFTASLRKRSIPEAWLFESSRQQQLIARIGELITVGDHELLATAISSSDMTLTIDGEPATVKLGDSIPLSKKGPGSVADRLRKSRSRSFGP
ncbi:MAG: hypothetical protein KDA80_15070 [Planctomycetaceae bacterium]|nr:hypothetical protein [Planctomycetaceae bacterium]